MKLVPICFLSLCLVGCALTQAERDEIILASSEIAADRAGRFALLKARDAGLSEEDSERLATLAREESRKVARSIIDRAVPEAEEKKRSKTGAAIASVLMALLQVGVAAAKRAA